MTTRPKRASELDLLRRRVHELERRLEDALEEKAVAEQRADRFRRLVEQSPDMVAVVQDGEIRWVNDAAVRLLRAPSSDDLVGRPVLELVPPERRRPVEVRLGRAIRPGAESAPLRERLQRCDGRAIDVEIGAVRTTFDDRPALLLGVRDVTERSRIQERLRHHHKLESLGSVAGGLAHQLGNLLTSILANADIAQRRFEAGDPGRLSLDELTHAAERAAVLSRQILAYSGRDATSLRPLSPARCLGEIGALLRSTIPSRPRLHLELDERTPLVIADPGQLQQMAMALVLDAAEAIGDRPGSIALEVGRTTADADQIAELLPPSPMRPGACAFVEVRHDGRTMGADALDRVVEPFLTSRFTGRGLGLATVLGIARGHGGGVTVGRDGSCLRVLLPSAPPQVDDEDEPTAVEPEGLGLVLVVDDEDLVRRSATHLLERLGYDVISAADGREAVRTFRRRASEISLVLLDMVMPVMDGEETFYALRAIRPGVRVLFSSGYFDIDRPASLFEGERTGFLQKPYSPAELASATRGLLRAGE